jgi:hypothetical protein
MTDCTEHAGKAQRSHRAQGHEGMHEVGTA